jgi:sugar/nucleoside kinase (ribokinase family)
MTEFIESRRDEVLALVARADVLFLTGSELAALTQTDQWRSSAAQLCGTGRLRAVVVKHGPRGAACVTATGITAMEAVPVTAVIDPTGAGDALAGGFLGRAAQAERDDEAIFGEALAEGLACAADAIVEFGTEGLRGTRTV